MKLRLSAVVFVVVALVLPLFFMSDFRLSLHTRFVIYGILAISLNFLWGYAGILSLGHGLFFSIGAYAMAMYLKLQSSGGGIPDFMIWSGLTELPAFWYPFKSLLFTLLFVVLAPVFCALFIGIPSFISGIKGVYFTILTQVITLAASTLFIGFQPYTGGTNGITNLTNIFGYNEATPLFTQISYLITLLVLGLMIAFIAYSLSRQAGKVLKALYGGENRLRFLGYKIFRHKVLFLCTSAAIAGIAGALFVPVVGIISPSSMDAFFSIEIAIWVAIGGRGTILGPLVGALFVNYSKTFFSENFPEFWYYFYGLLFIVVTLLLPKGIAGTIIHYFKKQKY